MLKLMVAVCMFLTACSGNSRSEIPDTVDNAGTETVHAGAKDTIITGAKLLVLSGCYEMIMKQDTAFLQLQVKDTTVSGNLSYHWYQKDRNEGVISGVLRNDLIIADYTFRSEGMTSVREVIFKIKDTSLLQGTGALREQNGKIVYQNKTALHFDETYPFSKVACRDRNK